MKIATTVFAIIFYLLSIVKLCHAQKKENEITFPDGTKTFHLISKSDTTFYVYYPNKLKEAECKLKGGELHGMYLRYYINGKKMWSKEMKNGITDGKSSFYNLKGELILELNYKNGKIIDTILVKTNINILLGNISYNSKVYGGVDYGDGRSNVSEVEGAYKNLEMNVVKLDSLKKPRYLNTIKTDLWGNFVTTVPYGSIGIYPKQIKLEDLSAPYNSIPSQINRSGNENWDVKLPINIKKNESINIVNLKHYSVGYAP
ncbi:MAG TPA: hypothetical protein PK323_08090 [Bacteroidia bacterium]|nr:hypothetical protein [Bacteroidia bacterium]